MESGIDPGQDYYAQDYYNYEPGYEVPQYGSRRRLISPSGLYDDYGEVVMEEDGGYFYSPQGSNADGEWARHKRVKLVVDREYETSSTGEDSASEAQRARIKHPANHSSVNSNIYVVQNGSIIRTRRTCPAANGKAASPARVGKHFKKLDRLEATQEERAPLNNPPSEAAPSCSHDPLQAGPPSGTTTAPGDSAGPGDREAETSAAKAKSELPNCHQETAVDIEDAKAGSPLECRSDQAQSDEEELWMGPWNNLHIPMTKL